MSAACYLTLQILGETLRIARLRIKELEAETNIQTTELNRLKEYVNASESAGRTMYGQQVDELKQVGLSRCTDSQTCNLFLADRWQAGVILLECARFTCVVSHHLSRVHNQPGRLRACKQGKEVPLATSLSALILSILISIMVLG